MRFNGLCDILNRSDAQVIGLKEVSKNVLQQRYYISDTDGRTFKSWYGIVMFIDKRLHFSSLNLIDFPHSTMSGYLIFANIKLDENETLHIGTTHLETFE